MRRLTVISLTLALMCWGCGGGEQDTEASPDVTAEASPSAVPASPSASASPSAPAATTAAPPAPTNDHGTQTFGSETFEADVELDDYYFEPTFIKSPGDSTANLTLENAGSVAHTFTVPGLDVDEELAPGASKKVTVKIGTETRYEFHCRYHRSQGMQGAFQPH